MSSFLWGVWVGMVGMCWFKHFNENSMQMSCSLIQRFKKKKNYILCMPNCVCQILYGMIETHGLSAKSSMFCFGMLAFNKYDLFLKRDTNENKQTNCNQIFLNHLHWSIFFFRQADAWYGRVQFQPVILRAGIHVVLSVMWKKDINFCFEYMFGLACKVLDKLQCLITVDLF